MKVNQTKLYLALSGIMLTLIGAFIAFSPMAYLQQFGLGSSQQVSLFSELRGMGGSFCGVGVLALLSVLFQKWEEPALVAAKLVFVSFTLFRTAGILIDGLPSQGILFALGIESVFGVLGLALLIRAGAR